MEATPSNNRQERDNAPLSTGENWYHIIDKITFYLVNQIPTIKMALTRRATAKRGGRACTSPIRRPNTVAVLMQAAAAQDQRVPSLLCQLAASIFQAIHSFTNGIIHFVK